MKATPILILACFILTSCQSHATIDPQKYIRQTKQAIRKTATAELTQNPNFPPDEPKSLYPSNLQTNVASSDKLQVQVSDPENDPLTVSFYTRPHNPSDEEFKIVVLPDPQIYSLWYPDIGIAQTKWIAANYKKENIVAVAHLGDSVHVDADIKQWENASQAIDLLGDEIPFGMIVGNHDQTPMDDAAGSTENFNKYFGVSKYEGKPYYGGHYGNNNDNSYILFSASGLDFVMLFLESDDNPDREVLAWAKDVLEKNSNRIGILVVHTLIFYDGTWMDQGRATYDYLKDQQNLRLMLCGHIPGEARRTDVYQGHQIDTLLSDYQEDTMGGNGFLRIMSFFPSENRIDVTTYSPTLDQYKTGNSSEFSLAIDLNNTYTKMNTQSDVESGTIISASYQGLLPDYSYDWYVEVSDGINLVRSQVWSFSIKD